MNRDLTLYALVASFVCVFLVGLIYVLISTTGLQYDSARHVWPHFIGGGMLFAGLNFCVIKLYRFIPASVAVFAGLLMTLSVVIFAGIFSDESLNQRQWMGAIVIAIVVVLVGLATKPRSNKKQRSVVLGAALALFISLLAGPAIVNEKYLIDTVGLETYLLFGWGGQALFSFFLAFVLRSKQKNDLKITASMHKLVWLYGSLLGIAGLFFVLTLKNSDSSSLTSVSTAAKAVTTVIFAYILLHEREKILIKLAGLVGASVGLFLLFT